MNIENLPEPWQLFGFPFYLVLPFILLWFYRLYPNFWLHSIVLLGLLVGSFYMPQEGRISFWLPGGAFVGIISTIIVMLYLELKRNDKKPTKEKFFSKIKEIFSDGDDLKNEFMDMDDRETRKRIYLKKVTQLSQLISKADVSAGYSASFYIMLCLFTILITGSAYWLSAHYINPDILNTIKTDMIKQITPILDDKALSNSQELIEKSIQVYFDYIFIFLIFFSSFVLFLILRGGRWIYKNQNEEEFLFLIDFIFFKVPPYFIFVYIPFIGGLIASWYYPVFQEYELFLENLCLVLSFFYLLQGISTLIIFYKVRFLPFKLTLGIMLILFYFFPTTFFVVLLSLFSLGLLDFAFEFRKKSLHFEGELIT